MSNILCPKCQKNPAPIHPMYGPLWCESCNNAKPPMQKCNFEFTTEAIRNDRSKYFKSMIQPYRQGELSREFVEAYPEKAQGMVKEGAVSQKQVRNAKYVWKGEPGWDHRDKTL